MGTPRPVPPQPPRGLLPSPHYPLSPRPDNPGVPLPSPADTAAKPSTAPAFVHPGLLHSRDDLDFIRHKVAGPARSRGSPPGRSSAPPPGVARLRRQPLADVVRGPFNNPDVGSSRPFPATPPPPPATPCNGPSPATAPTPARPSKSSTPGPPPSSPSAATTRSFSATPPATSSVTPPRSSAPATPAGPTRTWPASRPCSRPSIPAHPRLLPQGQRQLGRGHGPHHDVDWRLPRRPPHVRAPIDYYLHGEGRGAITHYVFPTGQCQESTRDQNHTQLGLGMLARACQVARTQGVDLFGAADDRLAVGFEYTAKYNLGEDMPSEGKVSAIGRGRFQPIYEVVYQHYALEKGREMPYTKRRGRKIHPEAAAASSWRGARCCSTGVPRRGRRQGSGSATRKTEGVGDPGQAGR